MKLLEQERQILKWISENNETVTKASQHFNLSYHEIKKIFHKAEFIRFKNREFRYSKVESYKDLLIPADNSLTIKDYLRDGR